MQSVNFHADQKLIDLIQQRLDKLENYYDKIIFADVYLKVQKTSEKENKVTEILLSIPGGDLMVKKTCKKFEVCVDECINTLQRQIKKKKEKIKIYA